MTDGGLAAFKQVVGECFRDSRYVLVLRNVSDLTLSHLKQQIDAGRHTPSQALSEAVVLDVLLWFSRNVRVLHDALAPLTVIDYEEARASGDSNNFLARICLGPDAPVLDKLKLNVSQRRDELMVDLLLSPARAMIATLLDLNPYSAEVRGTLSRVFDVSKLKKGVSPERAATLARRFDARLREITTAVYTANASRLRAEAPSLPASSARIFFPDFA